MILFLIYYNLLSRPRSFIMRMPFNIQLQINQKSYLHLKERWPTYIRITYIYIYSTYKHYTIPTHYSSDFKKNNKKKTKFKYYAYNIKYEEKTKPVSLAINPDLINNQILLLNRYSLKCIEENRLKTRKKRLVQQIRIEKQKVV